MSHDKKILVILNPNSRGGDMNPNLEAVKRLLASYEVDYRESKTSDEAIAIAADSKDYDLVIPLGGDGTTHTVVNGLMKIKKALRPTLAFIPAGSGNDSCRMAGIPLTLAEAIEIALTGVPRDFDIGICNDTYFVNSCGIGIDARIAATAVEYKAKTKLRGLPLYTASLFDNVFKDSSTTKMKLRLDEREVIEQDFLLIATTNGKTYGAGIAISPLSNPTDGKLNIAYVDAISFGKILTLIPVLFANKIHSAEPYHGHLIEKAHIETSDGLATVCQMDGEIYFFNEFVISMKKAELSVMTAKDFSAV